MYLSFGGTAGDDKDRNPGFAKAGNYKEVTVSYLLRVKVVIIIKQSHKTYNIKNSRYLEM